MAEFYERLVGDDWPKLPSAIQALHLTGNRLGAAGEFRVRHGQNGAARLLAWLLGFPPEADSAPVQLEVTPFQGGEVWARRFGSRRLVSTQREGPQSMLEEQFGPQAILFRLRAEHDGLFYIQAGTALRVGPVRIPLPGWLGPQATGSETVSGEDQTIEVKVQVSVPVVGLLIAYEGWLRVEGVD